MRRALALFRVRTVKTSSCITLQSTRVVSRACRKVKPCSSTLSRAPRDGKLQTCSRSNHQAGFRQNLANTSEPTREGWGQTQPSCCLWLEPAAVRRRRCRLPCANIQSGIQSNCMKQRTMKQGTAIIIGAGPAGLTAAIEFQRQSGIKPILIEASHEIGGISRTVRYKGNRMDIGGHRFFSKSDRVMRWWLNMMPVEAGASQEGQLTYHGMQRDVPEPTSAPDARTEDLVMLVRQRKSRIYFLRRFFDYPISLTAATFRNLGLARTFRCGVSYLRSALLPQREEKSLEDFIINRFGKQLYLTFFKSYTEKVWGVPCNEISAEWGAQRIKGLSLTRVVLHFLKKTFSRKPSRDIAQKTHETSLIEKFLYPKLGPGQLWEHAADLVRAAGGEIHFGIQIDRIHRAGNAISSIEGVNDHGERGRYAGDYLLSTTPVRDLLRALRATSAVPGEVVQVAEGMMYRDFITVGLLASRLAVKEKDGSPLKDNWIYIQEPDVMVGRLQIFNNWSPWLVD